MFPDRFIDAIARPAFLPALISFLLTCTAPAHAELELPRVSPQASVSHKIGLTEVTVDYSSPSVKGREIWGALVPYGKLWRAGANACTKVSFSEDVTVANKPLSAGEYCLFIIPNEEVWTVVFNTDATLSGTDGYSREEDALRADLSPDKIPARENLTYLFTDVTQETGNLRLEWETQGVSIPIFTATKERALEGIKALNSQQWRDYADAARYLLESEMETELALSLVERSIELEKTWFNSWLKAQLLARTGQKEAAVAAAKAAKELGDGSNFFNAYESRIDQAIAEWQ